MMDKIRARSLLKFTYVYNPPANIAETVVRIAKQCGIKLDVGDRSAITDLDTKGKLFSELGRTLNHYIPNSKLHKINAIDELVQFYSTPVSNVTKYAEMARSERLPKNLSILEQPRRFHPNNKSAIHGGITATPGEGGKILGIRPKRLYRQFKPKIDWYDYEDQTFNYDGNLSKGMPWDPEIAHKMDSYAEIKFTNDYLKRNK